MMPWLLLLLALSSGFGWLQTHRLASAETELDAVTAAYDVFKSQVAKEGKEAEKRAEKQAKADIQRAKESDDEAKKRYAGLDAQYAAYRLRQRAGNDATSRIVPASAPSAPSDTRLCYTAETLDRELAGALERFRGRLADSVEPYDRATITARTCRDWALK